MPSVEDLITTTELRGDQPVRVVNQRGLHHDELTVADVMTELAQLDAIELDSLRIATVSNVIATVKKFGRNHLLVVDGPADATVRRVRGVISRAQIERQIGTPIGITEVANNFAEIRQLLA